jgi:hypothetical protein
MAFSIALRGAEISRQTLYLDGLLILLTRRGFVVPRRWRPWRRRGAWRRRRRWRRITVYDWV